MKRTAFALTLTLALLFSVATGTQLVQFGAANPFSQSAYSGETSASAGVKPPVISITFPENNMVYNTNNLSLTFNVSTDSKTIGGGFHMITSTSIQEVYFTGDWLNNTIKIYYSPDMEDRKKNITKTYYMGEYRDNSSGIDLGNLSVPLTNIPDGNHSIIVAATGIGSEFYIFNWYIFHTSGRASVQFTIDSSSPSVTLLSLENKTYETPDIALNFTVNEQASHVAYSLDGQKNATIAGNTTLPGLADGAHNVTIYATDEAGNIGASETVYFSVEVPQPVPVQFAIVPVAAIAVIGMGLLVYFKKRNHQP
jgi:hypothetical protein